ncbi:NADP-dependent aldehyde dehydrogenase [Cnuella takakiae]|uniref:NADP-dependent aldehyde dehydrogenase n=1 Tax=Cnuella takakiae TaxID=1302690 RepID=A0A1M5GCZ1_9BACT|nr:aldehyde dehydrogenase (NADP(+)) [Cnuella takakiae]OLY94782.1 aldehyde dehydrogenase (NADP(+)) [Cnuella takakiae]SHG01362.1 NADP-dependent aldehyde dehydrogenase [Cnuella takakiae]
MFPDTQLPEINAALAASTAAFGSYQFSSLQQRASLLRAIARELDAIGPQIIETAQGETNLQRGRLLVEFRRTLFQLTSYADACEQGNWLDIRIDQPDSERQPPKPDVRKMLVPVGPVVVFGASNFPFAYSTAGGDTACALAAGCTVVVKAHPGHPATSQLAADAIHRALAGEGLPAGVFQHVYGASFEVGKQLVLHPQVKSVGFTGSFQGGRALFDLAASRKEPIPVFAEMGSVNPVFMLPGKLGAETEWAVNQLAASITTSVGQFCTNPGLVVGIQGPALENFIQALGQKLAETEPEPMLHSGIAQSFRQKRAAVIAGGKITLAGTNETGGEGFSIPTLATTSGENFLAHPHLHEEIFGPYSLVVQCNDAAQMAAVAQALEGQLTTTLIATPAEAAEHIELVHILQARCGRLVFNGVPTGVEVCLAMNHGGPYPATTDSRFTAVGADGIRRFARPFCYQNWPDHLLPTELQNANPLGLWRTVNGELTKSGIGE